MICKVIHSSFELDLSNVPITHIEENNWLNDQVLSKYTYPLEMDLLPEQILALRNINENNLSEYESVFDVKYYTMGEVHDAVLEIQQIIGKRALMQLRYGLEEFPNFSKRLAELPLEKFEVSGAFNTFAETIIIQTYPEVNFNFPQVITEKLDTDTDQWKYFEGIVNNRKNGAFLINDYDADTNEQINRNVMQPLPYLLHVLVKGFEDAGYTLEGGILEDVHFKKATLYSFNDYYNYFNTQQSFFNLKANQYSSINSGKGQYSTFFTFPEPGRYKVAGNIIIRASAPDNQNSSATLTLNGQTLWSSIVNNAFNYAEEFLTISIAVDFLGTEGNLVFFSTQLPYGITDGLVVEDAMILDVTITQLAKFDADGNLISTLVEPDNIDLTKAVPDCTFGAFANAIAKWKNYAINVEGDVVTMSKKTALIAQNDVAFDLTPFEVQYPERNFNQGKSFTFGFFNINNDEYDFKKMLITKDGYQLSPFNKPDDATEITVEAIALPLKQKGLVLTAHGFLDDNTKPQLVLYDGLNGGINTADDPEPLSIVNVYTNDHKDWFDFLLNSIRFVWGFGCYFEDIWRLKVKSKVYAYGQYHIIRRLTRKTLNDEVVSVDVETESLK